MTFLIAAYAVAWIAFFAFAFGLHRKQKQLAEEVAQLRSRMGD